MNRKTLRTGLCGHERFAEELLGGLPDIGVRRAEPYAARLAAGARMNLCFHDPSHAADLARPVHCLLGTVGHAALRDGDTERGEQLLGLVLVDVHDYARAAASDD